MIRSCKDCRHLRQRPKADLFSSAELQTAGGLKAFSEWQQQEKQHADREAQLYASGEAFTYEPHHYAWCAFYTPIDLVKKANTGDESALEQLIREGHARFNPVTGEVSAIYALCRRMNPRGGCEKHEC
jgi:hypothetical protein